LEGLRSGEVKAEVYCVGRTDFAPIAVGATVFVGADPATVLGQFQIEVRETDHRRSPRVRRGTPVPHWLFVTKTSLVRFAAPATIEPAVATANQRQSIDFDALLAFIKNHYATASERTNREKAKASAEKHFGRNIPAVAWRNAFAKAEIDNSNGRPRTRPRNP
jgi:hypothetical protein